MRDTAVTIPGAVANNLYEKTINLNVLLACKSELERHGLTVVCSRTKDENDPVTQEAQEANTSNADIAVSFHVNAGGGDGFEVFYYSSSSKGKLLAGLCEKRVKELNQNSRGLKHGDHLHFIKKTTMTAVLVESFFIDNKKDKTVGDTVAEQTNLGVAYAKAILDYFNIPYKAIPRNEDVFRVQVGVYRNKANAKAMQQKLKAAGFEAIVVQP